MQTIYKVITYIMHNCKVCLLMIFVSLTYPRFDLHASRTKERRHLMMAGIVKMKDGSNKYYANHRHCLLRVIW